MIKIAETLKEARKARGWNQKQLAYKCKVSTSSISSYEKGQKIPRGDILLSLMNALHITFDSTVLRVRKEGVKVEIMRQPKGKSAEIISTEFLLCPTFLAQFDEFMLLDTSRLSQLEEPDVYNNFSSFLLSSLSRRYYLGYYECYKLGDKQFVFKKRGINEKDRLCSHINTSCYKLSPLIR